MTSDAITILLPVYGRSELLKPALSSVLAQTRSKWQLLIADDGSDAVTQSFLERWMAQHPDPRIRWVRRPQNLGLFANLNEAIEEADTEWVFLLCSDDLLLPSAIQQIEELQEQWHEAGLILSTFVSINADGSERPADSAWHHDQVCRATALVKPEVFVPALLRLGSLNGNLTGMAFSRALWRKAGPFRSDWRHAADWEWLVRAASTGALVMNRLPLAQVRTHASQLSNTNRRSGHELQEVAEVVRALLGHPLLAKEAKRFEWAGQTMQFQLWNLLKDLGRNSAWASLHGLKAIHKSAGLRQSGVAMVRWLPSRWRQQHHPNSRYCPIDLMHASRS